MKRPIALVLLLAAFALGACSKPEPLPEPVRAVRAVTLQAGTCRRAAAARFR
jgi:hypothetical protein